MNSLAEIIFFGLYALRLALGVIGGEVANGKRLVRNDLQQVEVLPEFEKVDDALRRKRKRARCFRQGVFTLHVLAEIQPEYVYLYGVAVGRRHIFVDKLILDVRIGRRRKLVGISTKSHSQTPRNA